MHQSDLVVIGGGIAGACVAREAARRGITVTLLEMKDFGWSTSRANSRLIHGGLRYLLTAIQGMDPGSFNLVRESLRERNRLLQSAAHLVKPLKFLIPIYRNSPWYLRYFFPDVGFTFYNLLELPGRPPEISRYQRLSKKETLARLPMIQSRDLLGGVIYWDAQAPYIERLMIENLLDAAAHGAKILNHVEVRSIRKGKNGEFILQAYHRLEDQSFEITAASVANCSGPWVDRVLALDHSTGASERKQLTGGTRGTHVFIKKPTAFPEDLAVYAPSPLDGKPLFLLPFPGDLLMHGTTDIRFEGDPSEITPLEEEMEYLARSGGGMLEGVHFDSPAFSYVGVRPLVHSPAHKEARISRMHLIAADDQMAGLFSMVGCKLTPARKVASDLVNKITRYLEQQSGKKYPPSLTETEALPGGKFDSFSNLMDRVSRQCQERGLSAVQARYLAELYGSRALRVLEYGSGYPELFQPLCPDHPAIGTQVALAHQEEFARTTEDVIERRLCIFCASCTWTPRKCQQAVEEILTKLNQGIYRFSVSDSA